MIRNLTAVALLCTLILASLSACVPPDNSAMPTLAQLPTNVPYTGADATPTREGNFSPAPATPVSDAPGDGAPGSGAIDIVTGDLPELVGDGFAVRVTGAINEEWTAEGVASCASDGFVVASANARLTLTMPIMARAGLFDLGVNVDTQSARPVYVAPGNVAYTQAVEGVLVLDSLNLSDGGRIQGSFDFSASDGTNDVNLSGQFDLPASLASDCAG